MFSKDAFHFLEQLTLNNNKKWFLEHADHYQKHLIQPCKQLVNHLGLFILTIDENLEINPVVNKSLTTIYRDLRYSKHKIPFKNHMGVNFRRKTSEWKKYPAFFFRISPAGYHFGLTVMKNDSGHFEAFRKEIDRDPKKLKQVIKKIEKNRDLSVIGDDYKKFSFKGEDTSLNQYYCKKKFYISCFREKDYFETSESLVDELQDIFTDLTEMYVYLREAFLKSGCEKMNH